MAHIAGVFNTVREATAAVSTLLDEGFCREDISIILSDNAHHTIFSSPIDHESMHSVEGGAAGALLGGAFVTLINAGFAHDEANRYEKQIRDGKVVVVIHTADKMKKEVAARVALLCIDPQPSTILSAS